MTSWLKKPPKSVRSVEHAMDRAIRQKYTLPLLVQVHDFDWDLVILADEIKRLRKAQEK